MTILLCKINNNVTTTCEKGCVQKLHHKIISGYRHMYNALSLTVIFLFVLILANFGKHRSKNGQKSGFKSY